MSYECEMHGNFAPNRFCIACSREKAMQPLRDALEEIRDADPVDMALDPYWAARVAREALKANP